MERGEARRARVQTATAFLVAGAAAVVLALRGGTYDIVDRQATGLLVWWVLALGLALGVLPRAKPGRIALAPLVALTAFGAWTLVSLAWTASDERTLAEAARVALYAGIALLALLSVDRNDWRAAAAGVSAGALLVATLSTASRIVPEVFPEDPLAPLDVGRLSYPFGYWNAVGAWGAMAVSGGLAWSVAARSTLARAGFMAALPVAALSIYLSYSRASIGGLVVGVALALALTRSRLVTLAHAMAAGVATSAAIAVVRSYPEVARGGGTDGAGQVAFVLLLLCAGTAAVALLTRRPLADRSWEVPIRQARRAALAGGLALVTAFAAAGAMFGPRAWESFKETGSTTVEPDPSQRLRSLEGQRYSLWSATLEQLDRHPLRGTGAGTFEFTSNREVESVLLYRDAHSLYIEVLSELGVVGGLLLLSFVVSAVYATASAMRRARRAHTRGAAAASLAILGVWVAQAGVDWMWEIPAVTCLALGMAALGWARLSSRERPQRLPMRLRLPAAIACVLVCLLMLPGLVSNSLVRESQGSARKGDLARAGQQANDAVSAEPWAATPLIQRATVAEATGDLPGAAVDLRRASEREPDNWRPALLLARVEAERGRVRAALGHFRRAKRLRPSPLVVENAPAR